MFKPNGMCRPLLVGVWCLSFVTRADAGDGTGTAELARLFEGRFGAARLGSEARRHDPKDVATQVLAGGDIATCQPRDLVSQVKLRFLASFGVDVRSSLSSVGASQTAEIIARHPDAIVLAPGDLAYGSGSLFEYMNCFDASWGRFRDRIYPAPGNHDYKSWGARGYFAYWGARAGRGRVGYYSFNVPGWLILSLNSEADASPGSRQATWLRDVLEKSRTGCVLAYFHRPAFSAVSRPSNENAMELFRILYENGASIVLSAHNHFYERTAALDTAGEVDRGRGIATFVVGTGGGRLRGPVEPAPFTRSLADDQWGLLKLVLEPGRYRWEFLATDSAVDVDRGKADCVRRPAQP